MSNNPLGEEIYQQVYILSGSKWHEFSIFNAILFQLYDFGFVVN